MLRAPPLGLLLLAMLPACSSGEDEDAGGNEHGSLPPGSDPVDPLPAASCSEAGGSAAVSEPVLMLTLFDRWHEGWLASPAIADLDDDGENEIIVPRDAMLSIWHMDG